MDLEEKLILIAETIDVEPSMIKQELILNDIDEWDSMGKISIISMIDRKFSKVLSIDQITELKTVQDILNLMSDD